MDVDRLLAEQVAYYKARAAEYDEWWERQGQYDQGPEYRAWWRAEIDRIHAWLQSVGPLGSVLEIAAGTGNFTAMITAQAEGQVLRAL